MSLSKTSLIFNGARLQGKRERKGEHKTCLHEHAHTTLTYADNAIHYTLAQSTQSLHAQIGNTQTCTLVLRRKQVSLRVNGVETQGPWDWKLHSAWKGGERKKEWENKREGKRNWGALASIWEYVVENVVDAGRGFSAEHISALSEATFARQLRWRHKGKGDTGGAMIVEKKQLVEGKQGEIATHHIQKLYFLVSPPTYLSPRMSHRVIFS